MQPYEILGSRRSLRSLDLMLVESIAGSWDHADPFLLRNVDCMDALIRFRANGSPCLGECTPSP